MDTEIRFWEMFAGFCIILQDFADCFMDFDDFCRMLLIFAGFCRFPTLGSGVRIVSGFLHSALLIFDDFC